MGFISSLARSKFSPIFKLPLARNLSNCRKFGRFTCNDQALLFSRTRKKIHSPSPNLGHTHLRSYHYRRGSYSNGSGSAVKHGVRKWGPWVCSVCVGMVGYSVLVCWSRGHWETVPYTNRHHFLLSTDCIGRKHDYKLYGRMKDGMVDQNDPTSQRVIRIFVDILDALANDLNVGSMSLSYASASKPVWKKEKGEEMSKSEEISETKDGIYHLNGMPWEVLVVDSDSLLVFCFPNGKFVISTGLLKICDSDDEIATVIGHELGHMVARHLSEQLMLAFWLKNLLSVFKCIPGFDKLFQELWSYPILRPFSRRKEVEADQIGLMLMASAGYDPRKAPDVYKKLDSRKMHLVLVHPSGKKRAELLAKGSFMQQAMDVYNRVTTGAKQDDGTNTSTYSCSNWLMQMRNMHHILDSSMKCLAKYILLKS